MLADLRKLRRLNAFLSSIDMGFSSERLKEIRNDGEISNREISRICHMYRRDQYQEASTLGQFTRQRPLMKAINVRVLML